MSESPLTVRRVAPTDRVAWQRLWDRYNAFYGRYDSTALPLEVTETTWSRILDEHEPVHALLVERASEPVGLAHYLFHRSTIDLRSTCYLQDLYVAESVRGQGAGSALMHGVFTRAAAAGAPRVYWRTQKTNATARHLYDAHATKPAFVLYERTLP